MSSENLISKAIVRSFSAKFEQSLILDVALVGAGPSALVAARDLAKAGLKVGVYFFSQAVNEVEAVEEASMVLSQVKGYKLTYPVFIDVEPSGGRADKLSSGDRTKVINAFCQTIQNSGYRAGIYANKTWLETKLDMNVLNAYKVWLAQYASEPTYQGRYDMWQYKDTGKISGVTGNVDLNRSYLGY